MLYKFKTKNRADVIMVESTARQILDIIGKDAGPRGILQPGEMTAAVSALEAAVKQQEKQAQSDKDAGHGPATNEASLRQRAVPFIDLLRSSEHDGCDIVWGV